MSGDARPAAFAEQIRRFRVNEQEGIDLKPASAYEAMTRQMVEHLQEDLREIKGRLNGLLWMVAGTVLVDVVSKLAASF